MLVGAGACGENRPFERESETAQAKLAVPTSITPPISVHAIDGAPEDWNLAQRVAEALRQRDIPASAAAARTRAYVLKGEMRPGAARDGRSRIELLWSLYDATGKKVGDVTQLSAVPSAALKNRNDGVVESVADAAAESIAPLVPSHSLAVADGIETGERKPNERAASEERGRVTAVGKMTAGTGVAKNLLRVPAAPPAIAAKSDVAPPPATRAAPVNNAGGDKTAVTAVGRYEGASALSRNLLRPESNATDVLPPPRLPAKSVPDAEESLSARPTPASDERAERNDAAPASKLPPQRAEAEPAKPDVGVETQFAERGDRTPPGTASLPRNGARYWIQVGAHPDEAGSRGQLERLQGAHGAVLGEVGHRIQRADLGLRGVFFRLQFGPFESAAAAGQFCARLKARQVDCFLAAPEAAPRTQPPPSATRTAPASPPPAKRPEAATKRPEARVAPPPAPPPASLPPDKPGDPAAAAPKYGNGNGDATGKPETKPPQAKPPPNASAEKPAPPISTAPGLPGVLD